MEIRYNADTLSHVLDYSDHISPQEEVTKRVMRAIANDIDRNIRNTLIELGWTPPEEKRA